MSKVKDIVAEAKKNSSGRKTKNFEQYYQLLVAVCSDNEYIAKNFKEIKNGQVITEDLTLADSFKKIFVAFAKKNTNMSEAEAIDAANAFKLTTEQAKAIANIVHETDYLSMKECGKKVQMWKKAGFEVNMTINEAPEAIRTNPQDREKKVKIKKRDRVCVQQVIHDFQKEAIK
jgi:hypothetical protein